jgi:hypothetical protein
MQMCDTCGQAIPEPALPEPVVIAPDTGPNENDVKIAEIEAAASVEREKIWTEQQALALEADREELRGELRGMREVLDRLVPPVPETPEVVPVPIPAPAPETEAVPAPEPTEPKQPVSKQRKGFFG